MPHPPSPARVESPAPDAHPARAAVGVTLRGYVVVFAALLAVGWLWIEVVVPGPIGDIDQRVADWFVAQRTPALNDVTAVGSGLADTETVLAIVVIVGALLAWSRRWIQLTLLIVPILFEFCVFLPVSYLVDRPRPDGEPLGTVPTTSSFPSGHAAAATALYLGLALVVAASPTRHRIARLVATVGGVVIAVTVGWSRMYRGLHYPTDVVWGWVLGVVALAIGIMSARAARAARR